MTGWRHIIVRRAAEAAPVLSLALVLLFPLLAPSPADFSVGAEVRRQEVQRAVDAAPYRIGKWIGEDMPVPPAAVELLRPNAMLSRQFRPLDGGPGVELLIVNCGNARDMLGHYPPVCYPSAGWIALHDEPARTAALDVDGATIAATEYEFARMRDAVREFRIRIFNFFILPDGAATSDIEAVNDQAEQLAVSMEGVTQVQLIMPAAVPRDRALAAAGEVLSGMNDVLLELGFDPWSRR